MNIEGFSLAWRWTSSSHAKFSAKTLSELQPLNIELANELASNLLVDFPVEAANFDASDDQLSRIWLREINFEPQRVTISWDRDTALNFPWFIFCKYWDDFCYPSSDDADIILENGRHFLRWSHYEVFELNSSALK
jgi:hypothetical protein